MGNVPSTHISIENLCGAGYEMGFPKGADMKAPMGTFFLWRLFDFVFAS
jgi:hypothetical protein